MTQSGLRIRTWSPRAPAKAALTAAANPVFVAHLEHPDALVGPGSRAHARGARVARSVVDDEDLDVEPLAGLGERAVEARVDLVGMVVRDDQDRDEGGRSHSATIRSGGAAGAPATWALADTCGSAPILRGAAVRQSCTPGSRQMVSLRAPCRCRTFSPDSRCWCSCWRSSLRRPRSSCAAGWRTSIASSWRWRAWSRHRRAHRRPSRAAHARDPHPRHRRRGGCCWRWGWPRSSSPPRRGRGPAPTDHADPQQPASWALAALACAFAAIAALADLGRWAGDELVGVDPLTFHLPNVGRWIQNGSMWTSTSSCRCWRTATTPTTATSSC